MTDVADLVNAAKERGTFSVLDAVQGRGYPEDEVTVYLDAVSAYEVNRLEKEINDATDSNVLLNLDAEQREYKEKVRDSALTFRMRGVPPGVISGINKEAKTKFENTEYGEGAEWCNDSYLAAHIVSVTNAVGDVDEHRWNVEEVENLRGFLPPESLDQVIDLMRKLTFASSYFDASVTPDFS